MFRRISPALAACVALALVVGACSSSQSLLPEDVAADVNGDTIATDTLNSVVSASMPEEAATEEVLGTEQQFLSSLIQSVIATQAGADEGIELSESEVDDLLAENQEQVTAESEQFGMSEEDYVTYVLVPNEVVTRLYEQVGEDVSDEDVQAAYDEMVAAGQTDDVATVSHILVATEAEAVDVQTRLAAGESFEALAAELSIDTGSGANGGALGANVPLGNYVGPFAEAAREAEVGVVTNPVETEFGFHLLRVDACCSVEFDDVEETLRQQVAQAAGAELLTTAFTEAEVIVPARLGVWDGEVQGIVSEEPVGDAPSPTGDAPSQVEDPLPTDQ